MADTNDLKRSSEGESDPVMKEALERFRESQDASDFNRENFYEDMRFSRLSDQWPQEIRKQREQEGRPALVVNKLPMLIRSVVNEGRQAKPAIKVSPVDSGADEDTAEVISGLIRSIEDKSNASVAYDTALDCAVSAGFGFFRIAIDYANDESFELEARIERIPNPLSVHWDITSDKFDASDWDYCFVSDFVHKDEFKLKWPEASLVPFDGDSRDENSELWIHEDQIRIAEYWRAETKKRTIFEIGYVDQQGQPKTQVVREDRLPKIAKAFFEAGNIDVEGVKDKELIANFMEAAGAQIMREREVDYRKVTRRIINGVEVLEEDEWPGSTIPICPVWGDEVYLDGRRHFRSLIRDVKDSQMMFNFWRSATTELVALAPKNPWVGPKGFVPKGDEHKWQSANTRSHAYLEYSPEVDAPTRQQFASVPTGAIQESTNASMDMQDITGIYPAAVGARSNETSGKAILARERQGDVSNFHFIDNLNRAIEYCGRVLVEIIPSVYSPRESIRILGEDQSQNVVKLTQEAGGSVEPGVNDQPRLYNLSVGKYDVTVSSGPSFATQREETRETLIEIMRAVPNAAPFVGDVLLDHMDFVGADRIAQRLKALLPPEVRQAEESEDFADDPEKAALVQQNQAMQQQMQQAQQAVMQEIQKIQQENEALKQSNAADMKRLELDEQKTALEAQYKGQELELKGRELALREAEAMKPEPDQTMQIAADLEIEREKMAHETIENERNRQLEREKIKLQLMTDIMNKEGCTEEEADAKAERIIFQRDECGNIVSAVKVGINEGMSGNG